MTGSDHNFARIFDAHPGLSAKLTQHLVAVPSQSGFKCVRCIIKTRMQYATISTRSVHCHVIFFFQNNYRIAGVNFQPTIGQGQPDHTRTYDY